MSLQPAPFNSYCEIPAECWNLFRLSRRRLGRALEFGLPGAPGNHLRLNNDLWQCWNRRLGKLLMSWHDFDLGGRSRLDDPVGCELKLHHPYSRIVRHRVYDGISDHLRRLSAQQPSEPGKVLTWPGSEKSRPTRASVPLS